MEVRGENLVSGEGLRKGYGSRGSCCKIKGNQALIAMKKLLIFTFFAAVAVGCAAPAYSQPMPHGDAQARADAKANRRQAKAQKKYAKAQKKAEKKMLKTQKKNSYRYPSRSN